MNKDNSNIINKRASKINMRGFSDGPNTGSPDSIPGQGTKSHMPQLRPGTDK